VNVAVALHQIHNGVVAVMFFGMLVQSGDAGDVLELVAQTIAVGPALLLYVNDFLQSGGIAVFQSGGVTSGVLLFQGKVET